MRITLTTVFGSAFLVGCSQGYDLVAEVDEGMSVTFHVKRESADTPTCIEDLSVGKFDRAENAETLTVWQVVRRNDSPCVSKIAYPHVPAGYDSMGPTHPVIAGTVYRARALVGDGIATGSFETNKPILANGGASGVPGT